ncbi:DUF2844 domain-containing protein [Paraburkholderia ferrariae]|uniref:DUF2844 domain-containing protein n=1 Tax=Paraburkholderia ferrariae TaxID=386056 RepID=UPI000A00A888|nr:DUF2844 domain-containing protein [Paraburkholderia ferrariae]
MAVLSTNASSIPRRLAALTLAGAAAAALAAAPSAFAALGGAPMATPAGASVSTSSGMPNAVARQAVQTASASSASSSASSASWTVRQTTLGNGTVVREYLSQAGTVFGVGWTGPQPPDLSALLGSYFPQYVAGVKASRAAGVHGPGVVDQPGLVVHSGGHMGAFSGQAWVPQDLPAGVSASDIQ